MELKLKFKQIRQESRDCTAPYEVTLNKECTVRELIAAVLERKGEWGYIGIKNSKSFRPHPNCEYKYGKVFQSNLTDEELDSTIRSVSAVGGWTRMDYYITL